MRIRNSLWKLSAGGVLAMAMVAAPAASCQATLYDNGPDGDVGYYHVNFGSAAANSSVLTQPATVTGVVLTLYSVDDRNHPQHLKWTITTEPLHRSAIGGIACANSQMLLLTLLPMILSKASSDISSSGP